MNYIEYVGEEITKELLDSIKVGNTIKCNDWKRGMKVKAVSENYILMSSNAFGKTLYSVCEKVHFKGRGYNSLKGGCFSIGTDNLLFGHYLEYKFDDPKIAQEYLNDFETGEIQLSMRSSCALWSISIKTE